LEALKAALNTEANEKERVLNAKLSLIGNIVHSSCIDSKDERENGIVRNWWPEGRSEAAEKAKRESLLSSSASTNGPKKDPLKGVPGLYSHHEVLEKIEGYDPVRGANVAGHRGYFLTGPGVDLNLALIQYGLNFLEARGYKKIWTPFFMRRDVMAKTAQLEEFDEALYKVAQVEGESEDEAKYLIATSEQPISAYHAGEWFSDEKQLPLKCVLFPFCHCQALGVRLARVATRPSHSSKQVRWTVDLL
jgi:seryl-tRNA synthetase